MKAGKKGKKWGQSPFFSVVLFQNVTSVLRAEKILKANSFFFKIIPVPKTISSDCGLCVRFQRGATDEIKKLLCEIENISIAEI